MIAIVVWVFWILIFFIVGAILYLFLRKMHFHRWTFIGYDIKQCDFCSKRQKRIEHWNIVPKNITGEMPYEEQIKLMNEEEGKWFDC